MPYARKKHHKENLHLKKSWRTKRRTKDLDEIDKDLKVENAKQLINQEIDLDKPGAAQHYCIHCARYFINQRALQDHFNTKVHKRRLKALELEPYTIEDSERASGKGNFVLPKKRKIETIETENDINKESEHMKIDECFYANKYLNLNVLRPAILPISSNNQRTYTSALFVSGNKANKSFTYLTPDLNYDDRFSDTQKLQEELNLRGMRMNIENLKKSWDHYQFTQANMNDLKNKLTEFTERIAELKKNKHLTDDDKKEIEALINQCRDFKKDLKKIKNTIWEIEDAVVPEALKLPNEIDQQTPSTTPIILKSMGEKPILPEIKKQNHLDIGKNLNLLDYRNPTQCYLCNETALFELGVLNYAGEILNKNGTLRVAGSDFCRSFVVEGCGIDHENPEETFMLQNTDKKDKEIYINRLHLVGGASLPSLFAIYTKKAITPKSFPLKIFSTGRQYTPSYNKFSAYGLFSVCQETSVQSLTFVENKYSEEYKNEIKNLIEITSKIYDGIGCHYRIVIRSAKELNPSESMRISFEMWSVNLNQYVEVGHISGYGDYISKRLLFGYRTSKKSGFAAAIAGTLLSVPKVLGCLLEENPEKFIFPEKIAEFIC